MEEEIDLSLDDIVKTLIYSKTSDERQFKIYIGEKGVEQFNMMLLINMLEGEDRVPEHEKFKIRRLLESKDRDARKLGLGIWENFKNKTKKDL